VGNQLLLHAQPTLLAIPPADMHHPLTHPSALPCRCCCCCCLTTRQLREVGNQLLLHAQPTLLAIPGIVNYTEYYNKDQSPSNWTLRRDIKIGKTMGQMYMTTDGVLIFRYVCSRQEVWCLGFCVCCGDGMAVLCECSRPCLVFGVFSACVDSGVAGRCLPV
jgi:hypothetical protein